MIERRYQDLTEWERFYLSLARTVRTKSKDPSTKVGAFIARPDNSPVSFGYNGFPRGVADTESRLNDRAQKYPRTVHAELNAILNSRESLVGYTLFVTPLTPCPVCAGAIIQSGVSRVVAEYVGNRLAYDEHLDIAVSMFKEAGVKLIVTRGEE